MNQMLEIYLLLFNFAKKNFHFVRKKKNEINQTNLSIAHYYHDVTMNHLTFCNSNFEIVKICIIL